MPPSCNVRFSALGLAPTHVRVLILIRVSAGCGHLSLMSCRPDNSVQPRRNSGLCTDWLHSVSAVTRAGPRNKHILRIENCRGGIPTGKEGEGRARADSFGAAGSESLRLSRPCGCEYACTQAFQSSCSPRNGSWSDILRFACFGAHSKLVEGTNFARRSPYWNRNCAGRNTC